MKWGPHFEIRVGEQNNVTMKEGDARRWKILLSLPNTPLRLVSLRASLTADQKKQLKEKGIIRVIEIHDLWHLSSIEGYVTLSDVIPREMIAAALKTVNRGVAKGGDFKHMDKEFTGHPSISSLVNSTRIRGILENLLGGWLL